MQKNEKAEKDKYLEQLIVDVENDFLKRQQERIRYERQWELNLNFLMGNQYCDIGRRGEIESDDKTFYWQSRSVFNHIAPIIESRLAKFSNVLPVVGVRPTSDDDKDVASASLSEKIVSEVFKRCEIEKVVKQATMWSETCGTAFYKVVWNNFGGQKMGEMDGKDVYEGDVEILAISPFEIFPENLYTENLDDMDSVIHARVMSVKDVKSKYGVEVVGEEIGVFDMSKVNFAQKNTNTAKKTLADSVIVIERYSKPNDEFPFGRLVTVAGGKLLYHGDLPYVNGQNGFRGFPFVKQESVPMTGCFFGSSIIERLIPVQRAFNAVKNRKHEFLNRLSMGVMTVEDGSIDVDDLAEEGLSPGKVLVYRQGSKAPEMMSETSIPSEFSEEESKLLNEFVIISGVSDVVSSSSNAAVTSGTALEILVEQDNARLVVTAEEIRNSYRLIAKQVIRLYAQFTAGVRAIRYQDSFNKTKILYALKTDIKSDDVFLENENELLYTNRQKKDIVFELYNSGILHDEKGKLRPSVKEKVLTLLGYKDLDNQKGLSRLQEEKAQWENDKIRKNGMNVEEIDDDSIHIDEHVRYILSEYTSLNEQEKQRLYLHVREHKIRIENKGEN